MGTAELALFGVGYPASVVVITRFAAVVRERRWRWLAVHHVGVLAIITGCALRHTKVGVVVNGAWLVVSSAWYVAGAH